MEEKLDNFCKLSEFADDHSFHGSELSGYAAQAAAQTLLRNWLDALQDGNQSPLIDDIDHVIAKLEVFKSKALELIPVRNGGHGGKSLDEWKALLRSAKVEVTGDGFHELWRFTGLTGPGYNEERSAVLAAVKRHLWDGGYLLNSMQMIKVRTGPWKELGNTGWILAANDDVTHLVSTLRDVCLAFPAPHPSEADRQRCYAEIYAYDYPERVYTS